LQIGRQAGTPAPLRPDGVEEQWTNVALEAAVSVFLARLLPYAAMREYSLMFAAFAAGNRWKPVC
jgi:hypothetical protein